jgi:class 3 adenylate cyclase
MRRRLATLFVDIAGSTRLVVRHPPETVLGVVQCFAELVTDVGLGHGGRVKDFEGDGVLLYFESAVDATEAALAIRAALEREGCAAGCRSGPGAPVRMSLTLGEVAVGAVGPAAHPALALVGPSVNLGARLLKVVPPGGIAASAEMVATLESEAPALAGRFRLLEPAFEVPGGDGVTLPVYALEEPSIRDEEVRP